MTVPLPEGPPPGFSDPDDSYLPPDDAPSAAGRGDGRIDGAVDTGPVSSVDVEAELRLLAAVFADSALLDELAEKVAAEDFGVQAHEMVFAAMVACDTSGRPVDVVTVADELTRSGALGRVGDVAGLRRIAAAGASPAEADGVVAEAVAGFSAYADIVYDRATRRRLVTAATRIRADATSGETTASTLVESAEAEVFAVSATRAKSSVQNMTQVVAAVTHRMANARSQRLVGYSTGFSVIDDVTGGLQGGQMITIAARPGMGKSVLAIQVARLIAETHNVLVPVFSYEMQSTEIGLRMLASSTGIPLGDLMRGHVPDGMDRDVARAAEKLAATPLLIDDRPPTTIAGVRSAMRRLSRRGQLGAMVVDYLQLVDGNGNRKNGNRENEVSEISRTVKLMSDEFNIPTIVCSQLNRGLESRPNKRPLLSDLRESGAIEQDSSVVIFVHRPGVYDPSVPESEAELIVAKNRNGATTTAYVDWQGPQVRFRDSNRTGPSAPAAPAVNGHGANGGGHGGPSGGGGDPWAGSGSWGASGY